MYMMTLFVKYKELVLKSDFFFKFEFICRFIQDILGKVYEILKSDLDSRKSETFEMDLIEDHCQTIVKLECKYKQVRTTCI